VCDDGKIDALAHAMACAVEVATRQVATAAEGGYGLANASAFAARLELACMEQATFYALTKDAAEAEAEAAGMVARPGPRARAIALRTKVGPFCSFTDEMTSLVLCLLFLL